MVYGFGLVAAHAAHWQLANAEVDDNQRHSTLFLGLLLGRLLEVALFLDFSLKR